MTLKENTLYIMEYNKTYEGKEGHYKIKQTLVGYFLLNNPEHYFEGACFGKNSLFGTVYSDEVYLDKKDFEEDVSNVRELGEIE
jgi:hypothetical protein